MSPLRSYLVAFSRGIAKVRPASWMCYDAVVAACALTLGFVLTPKATGLTPDPMALAVFALALVAGGNIVGLYDRQELVSRLRLLLSLAATACFAVVALSLFANLVLYEQIGRWILLIASAICFGAAAAPRLAGHYAASLHKIRVLLVGEVTKASPLVRRLCDDEGHYALVGFCNDTAASSSEAVGSICDIPRLCREQQIDEIVIANGYVKRADVLYTCLQSVQWGCRVLDEASFCEDVFEEIPVDQIDERWFYTARIGGGNPLHDGVKRCLDVSVALAGLALTLPLAGFVWLAIRLTSPGPAIYSQVRCGRFGKEFKIYKFRSMYAGAEPHGARWAGDGDPRVTPVGRFLRRTRLDEVPQFWNVLKGDMSIVGPRPERPELVAVIEKAVPYFAFRHLVRPGVTGLAQIRFKYGSSIHDARRKLQHDLYYIKKWSVFLDLHVLLRTISSVMKGSR